MKETSFHRKRAKGRFGLQPEIKPRGLLSEEAQTTISNRKQQHLLHAQDFEVEDELRVWRNLRWCTLAAIAETRRNGQPSLPAHSHAHDANIPAFDDFAGSELEAERFALLVCYQGRCVSMQSESNGKGGGKVGDPEELTVKNFAILQLADVAHLDMLTLLC